MHKARAFFFVAAGSFLLALAFHLGAMTATAQAPSNPVVAIAGDNWIWYAVTANGDVYGNTASGGSGTWTFKSNVFGGATPASQPTWGQVKAKYRQGAATRDK